MSPSLLEFVFSTKYVGMYRKKLFTYILIKPSSIKRFSISVLYIDIS